MLERETGIAISSDDVNMIFKRYDSRGIGQIGYSEFCNIVMPHSKEYAGLLSGR